ncbi:MAG: aminomethyl-transferring glycine dehydrogenase subunit GcvPA [Firmicutes bacterium]|nr:aminomethyl-transferring glycine dehydrogenase subunit GcvPA [Bacillota bacterium]MDD7016633.1 aminomethyl-transferring glycine dehydrogenase subunit GcvPA [Bacillota bacterium]
MAKRPLVHPYIPNSVPEVRKEMMDFIGIKDIEEIYAVIPEKLRFREKLDVPEAFGSEAELKAHVEKMLGKNVTCKEYTSYLGGGCWNHYVPAVVDEVVNRAEFVTAYCGGTYSDLGKFQARFEFYSMMGELCGVEAVSEPIYDWATAAGFSLRMASRITGRNEVLVPSQISPDRLAVMKTQCQPEEMNGSVHIIPVAYDPETGNMDMADLKSKLSDKTAGVYFEMPGYFGNIESDPAAICAAAHEAGAVAIVGVDPISLGVLEAPANYGADIICGDLQSLGVHMYCGGGQSGFIAMKDEEKYLSECPLAFYTCVETVDGQFGYAEMLPERTSYEARDKGKDWVGTASGLWTIAAAVYMSLMGPQGMTEIGETLVQNANYAKKMIESVPGVTTKFNSTFKEFVVNFDGTGKTVAEINKALEGKRIFGGIDLSDKYPEMGQSALYCVTEVISVEDIKELVEALKEVC